ncbi:MAG: glycosyltransferase family 10 [Verrucomicrobiota bacterium]
MRRSLTIAFADPWQRFDPEDNFFTRLLRRRYEVTVAPRADYTLCFGYGFDFLRHDGVRIFFAGENLRPDFNLWDYALGFDRLTFGDRYYRFPLYRIYEPAYAAALRPPAPAPADAEREFCSFVVSNHRASRAHGGRVEMFERLSAYRRVASGGRFRNNVGGPVTDKLAFLRRHKFNLAFENTSAPGYTTEKLVEAKAAGTVPIYWGNPEVAREFNARGFVNCHDFAGPDAVVARVRELDRDPAVYLAMLAEPLFPGGVELPELKLEPLLDFFGHIFDQPPALARRRVTDGRWGPRAERFYRLAARLTLSHQWQRLTRRFRSSR